ncbi:alpha/beta hydrolase [Paenibacillus albiflavus]|uniref:Alpha/beta hydrolase n=1 Tax=Paenibacillus albiflavus TaxID=2545760 RepID=A0A4R4EJ02_9BACL|nr:alpha/beta hydrolase [Paenibacillus albiflavus]TCZ79899.1 alpha/beta hydrolase [Paenibacillus albiflavus]
MDMKVIKLPSVFGREVTHKYVINQSSSLVVMFPGKYYPCDLPVLYYANKVAVANKHDVLRLEYGYQSARTEITFDEINEANIVKECLEAINQVAHSYDRLIFVSKSIGTIVAGKVAELMDNRAIEHLFLTPLDSSIPYIQKNSGMVIYGTKDWVFSAESAEIVKNMKHIKTVAISNADHVFELEQIQDSYEALGVLIQAYQEFLSSE